MIRPAVPLWAALILAVLAPSASATNDDARIVLHLTPPVEENACLSLQALPHCDQIVSQGSLYPAVYFAHVLVTNADATSGLAGLQFGIDYDPAPHSGVDVFSWTLCGTLQFASPEWPASGYGNMITWDPANNCQRWEPGGTGTGVIADAGYFYVAAYTPDDLEIMPRPVDGYAKVANCSAAESVIEGGAVQHVPPHLGYARFSAGGTDPGYNPCVALAPPPLACSVFGPESLVQQATGNYVATSNNSSASFTWSISGNGTFVGPAIGPSVYVQATGPGSFQLTVTTYAFPQQSTCSKQVTVTAAPSCAIAGPSQLAVTSAATYSVTSTTPGAAFAWSITGNGTIYGSTTGPSVQVITGDDAALGGITLTVAVTSGGFTGTCTREVTVLPAAACTISGPSGILQGTTMTYTVSTSAPATGYQWSISGYGTITGSATGASVQVTALTPGSFGLTCNFTTPNGPGLCQKTVTVEADAGAACQILGESEVLEGTAYHQYQASTTYSNATFSWAIEGSGTITTVTTGPSIRVSAGAAGWFRLSLFISAPGVRDTCSRTVTVTPGSGGGSNNARAKVMFHVQSPTTKNACARSTNFPTCNGVVAHGDLYPSTYFSYVLMTDGYTNGSAYSGIAGLTFGIDYNGSAGVGVDVWTWVMCGTAETPGSGWPAPGTGNRVTWNPTAACQRYEPGGTGTGVVTTAGYLYMGAYSPDQLRIVPPPGGAVLVTDCLGHDTIVEGGGVTHSPTYLGSAGFGPSMPGYVPCGFMVPVLNTTWSGIKTLYR